MSPPTGTPPLRAHQQAALLAEILLAYAVVRTGLLRRRPLPQFLEDLRADPGTRRLLATDPVRLGAVVQKTLGPLPFDTRCLSRSLVLLALLTHRGRHADLVIGADPSGTFEAHAWVELDGRALLPAWPDSQRLATL